MIILDFGSGNTCKNDMKYIVKMYDELCKIIPIEHRKKFVIKWQLFEKAGDNIPLDPNVFHFAYNEGVDRGFPVTASVFDDFGISILSRFSIPFVKFANNKNLWKLRESIPKDTMIIQSVSSMNEAISSIMEDRSHPKMIHLGCVSKYPCDLEDYDKFLPRHTKILMEGLSDHTESFDLYEIHKPEVYEFHYKLEDSTGPDAGPFARTPKQIKEWIDEQGIF